MRSVQRDPVPAGGESVWDYPRPPRVETVRALITIDFGGRRIAETTDVVRVLETSHPPVYYLPADAFEAGALRPGHGSSFCEFKGGARYYDVIAGDSRASRAAWHYPTPSPGFEALRGRVAVYAGPMDACRIDGELVTAQPGAFYGGWITAGISGPFKGGPGTMGW